ncbi:MAG: hypothetical protein H0T79_13420 [Deltaproteobacteria bacterium]|nr:hypothetical protein [Deltaproteobacteria bacterium]
MSLLFVFLQYLELALRLSTSVTTLPLADAAAHVAAARAASTERITPELLLAIAFVESRFDVTAVSRVEGHKRKTGRYPSTQAPASLDRRASLYCGPLQTFAGSWAQCLEYRDLPTAYAAAAAELEQWLGDRRVHGDVTRALAGHGCGNYGVTTGKCNGYPGRVLGMQQRFTLEVNRPTLTSARRKIPNT